MTLTRQQFLARAANAYDTGRANPETLRILERWADDLVMRLEGGQMDMFTQLWELEKDRLNNFYVKLANDTEGYKAVEFMAILNHHCQACAIDPSAWWTRSGFCQHTDAERAGAQAPEVLWGRDAYIAERLAELEKEVRARRELGHRGMPLSLDMAESLLAYIGELERAREVVRFGEEGANP